jgi:hypothetical protein
MKKRRLFMRVKYVFDLGSDALPIDVQAKAKGLRIKDVDKVKKILEAAELLTDSGVFSLTMVEQVWTKLGKIISDHVVPEDCERCL